MCFFAGENLFKEKVLSRPSFPNLFKEILWLAQVFASIKLGRYNFKSRKKKKT